MFRYMSLDLNTILKDWPHESGSIKVRKVTGLDGREKLQLRVDLGVLQMEMSGRPDGQHPHNCESLLQYHQKKAACAGAKGEPYELTSEGETPAFEIRGHATRDGKCDCKGTLRACRRVTRRDQAAKNAEACVIPGSSSQIDRAPRSSHVR